MGLSLISVNGYEKPDGLLWGTGDRRRNLTEFDAVTIKRWYDKQMPLETKPILTPAATHYSQGISIWLDEIKKVPEPRTLLEIGCSAGRLVFRSLLDGFFVSAVGLDISSVMVDYCLRSCTALGIKNARFESIPFENFISDTKFSVIAAEETLEHIYALRAAISKIASLLLADGIFYGVVPFLNVNDGGYHLHYFTVDSLNLLLKAFFSDVSIEKVDYAQNEWHLSFVCKGAKL